MEYIDLWSFYILTFRVVSYTLALFVMYSCTNYVFMGQEKSKVLINWRVFLLSSFLQFKWKLLKNSFKQMLIIFLKIIKWRYNAMYCSLGSKRFRIS